MPSAHYREALEDAVRTLHMAETEIFTAMVNLGFRGVYEDIGRLHEEGEVLNLELAMFENTDDANLEALVQIIQQVAETKASLMNMNNLEIDLEDE